MKRNKSILRKSSNSFSKQTTKIKGEKHKGYLIKDTTREEREKIVEESLSNILATCDGCMTGLAETYQDYIDGKKELREINMEFHACYISGDERQERSQCSGIF